MQKEQLKSCGNCVFLQYTETQKKHAEKHKADINKTLWGFCPKQITNVYKKEICEKHEPKNENIH